MKISILHGLLPANCNIHMATLLSRISIPPLTFFLKKLLTTCSYQDIPRIGFSVFPEKNEKCTIPKKIRVDNIQPFQILYFYCNICILLYLFFVHYLRTPHPQAILTWPSFGILTALSISIDMSTKQHYLEGGRQGMLQTKT